MSSFNKASASGKSSSVRLVTRHGKLIDKAFWLRYSYTSWPRPKGGTLYSEKVVVDVGVVLSEFRGGKGSTQNARS